MEAPDPQRTLLEAELAATKASLATLQQLVSELAHTQPQGQPPPVQHPQPAAYSGHPQQPAASPLQRQSSNSSIIDSSHQGGSLQQFAMFQLPGANASSTSLAGLAAAAAANNSTATGSSTDDLSCSAGMLAAMEALSVSHNQSNTPFNLSGSLSSSTLAEGGQAAEPSASRMPSMHALLQQGSAELPGGLTPALSLGDRSFNLQNAEGPLSSGPLDASTAAGAGTSHTLLPGLSMLPPDGSSYPAAARGGNYQRGAAAVGPEASDASWPGMRDDQGNGSSAWGHQHGGRHSRLLDPAMQQLAPMPLPHPPLLPPLQPMAGGMVPPLLPQHGHGGSPQPPFVGRGPPGAADDTLLQQQYALLMDPNAAAAAAAAAAGLGHMPPPPNELLMGMGAMPMHPLAQSLAPGTLQPPPGSDWEQALAFANAHAAAQATNAYVHATAQAQLAHAHATAMLEQHQHALLLQQQLQAHYNPYARHLLALAAKQHAYGPGGGYPRFGGPGARAGRAGGRGSWGGDIHRGRDTARKPPHPLLDKTQRQVRTREDPPDWRRVFVGNIGWWVDEGALEHYFSKYGKVTDTQVMWNTKLLAKGKKVNREFAFVSYSTPEEAGAAIRGLNRVYIEGLTKDRDGLTVQYEAQGHGHSPAGVVVAGSGPAGAAAGSSAAVAAAASQAGKGGPMGVDLQPGAAAAGTAGCREAGAGDTHDPDERQQQRDQDCATTVPVHSMASVDAVKVAPHAVQPGLASDQGVPQM